MISSRRTFGSKLYGDLSSFGFQLYSKTTESQIKATKLICQLDSFSRLDAYIEYDIVIIDECESLLRYLTSKHIT